MCIRLGARHRDGKSKKERGKFDKGTNGHKVSLRRFDWKIKYLLSISQYVTTLGQSFIFSYPQIFYDFAIIELGAVLDNVNLLSRDLVRKSRLSTETQYRLIEHFVAGTTARCASSLVGVNRKTVAYFYHRLRQKAQAASARVWNP